MDTGSDLELQLRRDKRESHPSHRGGEIAETKRRTVLCPYCGWDFVPENGIHLEPELKDTNTPQEPEETAGSQTFSVELDLDTCSFRAVGPRDFIDEQLAAFYRLNGR